MEYLVIFLNYDGSELYKTMVEAGGTVVYEGAMPEKPNEKFVGWNKPLTNVNDNMFITAVFEKTKTASLKLGAMTFIKNNDEVKIIDNAVITNKDLYVEKENDVER